MNKDQVVKIILGVLPVITGIVGYGVSWVQNAWHHQEQIASATEKREEFQDDALAKHVETFSTLMRDVTRTLAKNEDPRAQVLYLTSLYEFTNASFDDNTRKTEKRMVVGLVGSIANPLVQGDMSRIYQFDKDAQEILKADSQAVYQIRNGTDPAQNPATAPGLKGADPPPQATVVPNVSSAFQPLNNIGWIYLGRGTLQTDKGVAALAYSNLTTRIVPRAGTIATVAADINFRGSAPSTNLILGQIIGTVKRGQSVCILSSPSIYRYTAGVGVVWAQVRIISSLYGGKKQSCAAFSQPATHA